MQNAESGISASIRGFVLCSNIKKAMLYTNRPFGLSAFDSPSEYNIQLLSEIGELRIFLEEIATTNEKLLL